jgi:hypothetical protein
VGRRGSSAGAGRHGIALPGDAAPAAAVEHRNVAVVPPGWIGTLPEGLARIDAPTPYVWMIGRTQTNGPADYDAVHDFQDGLQITPLSESRRSGAAVVVRNRSERRRRHAGPDYFTYAAELLKLHPPHLTDHADPVVQKALQDAPAAALAAMNAKLLTLARVVNGWQMNTDTMGVYGNYYLKRAVIALAGLGANHVEDAIYPWGWSMARAGRWTERTATSCTSHDRKCADRRLLVGHPLRQRGLPGGQPARPVRHRRPQPAHLR